MGWPGESQLAHSSREFVGPDVSAAVSFESYPRFIKGGFQDYEGLGIKRSTADSKHVPSPRSRLLGKHVFWSLPQKVVESLKLTGTSGRSCQIEAIENRGTSGELLDQRSNQAQEFLLLRSVTSRDQKGSELNVRDLST